MKRPNKNEYLKYGINAGITLDLYDKYIDYLESQLKERDVEILKSFFEYLCDKAEQIPDAYDDFEPEVVTNIIKNFMYKTSKTNEK